jgi:hypothetical protein
MRSLLQIAFLFFYAASTFAAGQTKTEQIVQELQHSDSGDDEVGIDQECPKVNHGLPKYREAKKANNDFQFRPVDTVVLAPATASWHFVADAVFYRSQLTLDRSHSRAPPTLS